MTHIDCFITLLNKYESKNGMECCVGSFISPKFFAVPLVILCFHLVLETRKPVAHRSASRY